MGLTFRAKHKDGGKTELAECVTLYPKKEAYWELTITFPDSVVRKARKPFQLMANRLREVADLMDVAEGERLLKGGR